MEIDARFVVFMTLLATGACSGSSEGIDPGAGAGGDSASGGSAGHGAGTSGGGSGGQALGGTGGISAGGVGGNAAGATGAGAGAGGSGGASAGAGGSGGASAGAGGSGGASAGAGGASAGAGAASGGGGVGGELGLVCSTQTGHAQRFPDPDTRETTTGTNGTFTDECDAEGKLTEYYCAYETRCDPNMTECAPYPTGQVISRTTECMFVCGGGACMYPAN